MSNFRKALRRFFLDQTKTTKPEEFCSRLQAIGVNAKIIRDAYSYDDDGDPQTREIWIAVTGEPIQLIIVRQSIYLDGDTSRSEVNAHYLVNDSRVAGEAYPFIIGTVRMKNFPLFGKVVDLQWEGSDTRLGLINQLQGDMSIKRAIMKGHDIKISAGDGEWAISPKNFNFPTDEEWNCYQAIARYLLALKF